MEVKMTRRLLMGLSLLVAIGTAGALLEARGGAQYSSPSMATRYRAEWQSGHFDVRRIAIAPGARLDAPWTLDAVLVYLTADLDGRMPSAEVAWRPRGSAPLENHARTRFEAIAIGLNDAPPSGADVTPPEALVFSEAADSRVLLDNPRVLVLKTRYRTNAYPDPLHFHPQDMLSIYLNGGYMWTANVAAGPSKVTRGDVELVPANTLHAFANAGSDSIDLLAIVPK
jgi:quercetin dioxygenase-like cupin family protein